MKKEMIKVAGSDGISLQGVLWIPEGEPKALLQITHGMTEHIGRYTTLAEKLTSQGIVVAGFDHTTPLVRKLSFETYNQKFAPNRTSSDWLCADEMELDAYLADPLCRENISAGLFWQLLGAMKRTGSNEAYDNWNKSIPVLLLSGQDDPVGDSGKGVIKVKHAMDNAGIENVTMNLFSGARHDLLHEESSGCAKQVRKILTDWILEVIL